MDTKFGEYLRNLRKNKGFTLKDLAKLTGLSHSYLSQLERGIRGSNGAPSPELLRKLSEPLGVDYYELMEKAGYFTPEEAKERRSAFKSALIDFSEDIEIGSSELDLKTILESDELVFYKGIEVSENNRQLILAYLDLLYKDYKE